MITAIAPAPLSPPPLPLPFDPRRGCIVKRKPFLKFAVPQHARDPERTCSTLSKLRYPLLSNLSLDELQSVDKRSLQPLPPLFLKSPLANSSRGDKTKGGGVKNNRREEKRKEKGNHRR